VFAFDAFPDGARGVPDDPFAGLLPRASEARAFPLPRTHVPLIDRSVAVFLLRDRPARLKSWGALLSFPPLQRRASTAAKRGKRQRRTASEGSVDRGWIGSASGFPFSACGPRGWAFVVARSHVILPWALASLRFDGCERRDCIASCTNGQERLPHRVPPVARSRLSRDRIRSWVCVSSVGLAMSPVSNTSLVVRRVCDVVAIDRSPLQRDAIRRPCRHSPLTSLQRIEATDALPIRMRAVCARGSLRTGSLSEVLHRP
jgi:hypothetical protein